MARKLKVGGDKPTMVAGKPFKCSKCGCVVLEEVMGDVTQSSNILSVGEEGEAEYEHSSTDGGVVDRIQCLECGLRIAATYEELVELAKAWPKK